MSDSQQTLNIPQLAVLIIIGALVLRWLFSSSNTASGTQNRNGAHGSRINPAHVEQLLQMFPQLDRRTVMWELQRGSSVQSVTERVLGGRGLQQPPPSFQPPPPSTPVSTASRPAASSSQPKPSHPDLITKYNLASKLSAAPASTSESESGSEVGVKKRQAWSNNKNERQALLQKRREEMILAARRKIEEKDRVLKT